jgi:hypothetical protein
MNAEAAVSRPADYIRRGRHQNYSSRCCHQNYPNENNRGAKNALGNFLDHAAPLDRENDRSAAIRNASQSLS